jgi:N,N'-diacetyllegionaminate synthase
MMDIILIGAGGHAASCIDVIESDGRFRIAGLVGTDKELHQRICGYEVIGTDSDLQALSVEYSRALVTVGQVKSAESRRRLYEQARAAGFELPVIVSPHAHVSSHARIGEGSIIMYGAMLNAGACIGANCIINSHALVEHGVNIGDHCHISTGVILNGDVRVGPGSFVGSGTLTRDGVSIGGGCFVGMGSVVRCDLPEGTTHCSSDARSKVVVIAEAGVNHNGDLDIARRLIDVAAESGADIVKFQTFNADRLATKSAVKADYQVETTGSAESQHEMLRRLELSPAMHDELISHAARRGIEFMSTAFDEESVDLLAGKGLKRFKVPSGEITNLAYLRRIASVAEEVIISTGMATLAEIGAVIAVFDAGGVPRSRITILHCTTDYPARMQDVNLRAMLTIAGEFGVKVGYSDHTQGIEIAIAAVAMGACVIEKHFTLDQSLPGPDHKASLEPDQLKAMVAAIRNIEQAMGDGVKRPSSNEVRNLPIVRKSLVATRSIVAGEPFNTKNVGAKRPGTGISPMRLDELMGKPAPRGFKPDELIEL